jgi:hypothetical protein
MTPEINENPGKSVFTDANNTSHKFIAGDFDTGEQLIASVVDIGD